MNSAVRDISDSSARTLRLRLATADVGAVCGLLALAALSLYRSQLVQSAYGEYVGCRHCFDASVWSSDAIVLGVLCALVALSRLLASRALRALLALVAFAVFAAYAGDVVTFRLLSQRLLFVDLLHFGREGAESLTVLRPWIATREGALVLAVAICGLAATLLAFWRHGAGRRSALAWALVTGAVLIAVLLVPPMPYVHRNAYLNFWQVNRRSDPGRPYSAAFFERMRGHVPLALACEAGHAENLSVILVVVESLSAYHSRLFSGLNDDTPQLDALATRHGSYFTHFYANGFSTEGGLIALLTGAAPIPTAGRFGSTMAFTAVEDDFHRRLERRGYDTAFFTTGRITWGQRDRWLRALGMDHVEGSENRFYQGLPRGAFDAPQDAALVERFLQWFDARGPERPFMATLLTVGTHPPFYSPVTGTLDQFARFREADAALAHLVRALDRRGFLSHGVVVIVGDHRAMTPIPKAEMDRLGPSAPWRVMGLAFGQTGLPPGEQAPPVQQTDLIPSLRYLLSRRACRTPWQGRFLGGPIRTAADIVLSDPLHRNQLVVAEPQGNFRLLLDGDDTRWIDTPPADGRSVLDEVNAERMARMN